MSANGFVATTSNATTPSARSAAAWPASSSSGRTLRRGSSRSRATIHPSPASTASAASPPIGQWTRRAKAVAARRPARHRAVAKSAKSAPHHGPESEPAAIAAERRRDADPPAAAAREEVDRRREERQQRADEHELDRPAADDAAAEIDVARRRGRERDPLLQRVDHVLRRALPDLPQPRRTQPCAAVLRARSAAGRPPS